MMKYLLTNLFILGTFFISFGQGVSFGVIYTNAFLSSNTNAYFYPTTVQQNRVNIVVPATFDLSTIRFPGITISTQNLQNPTIIKLDGYRSFSTITGSNFDLSRATHNLVISNIQDGIETGELANGCSAIAVLTVEAGKKWLPGFCPVAETPPTLAACALGVALQNTIVRGVAQKVVEEGCSVTTEYVSDQVIKITLETNKKLKNSLEEAKHWLGFVNSVEGMIWLMNRFQN